LQESWKSCRGSSSETVEGGATFGWVTFGGSGQDGERAKVIEVIPLTSDKPGPDLIRPLKLKVIAKEMGLSP
jgi:hypothetical protein